MATRFPRVLLASLMAAALGNSASLPAQTAQAVPKVSSLVPAYQPGAPLKSVLQITGTDELQDLGEVWNRKFMVFHPQGGVSYIGKLTRDAITDLVAGRHPIVLTSRELTPDELQKFVTAFGYQPMRIPICLDANIVFVHPNNPLVDITMEELDAIYSSTRLGGASIQVTTWGTLGARGEFLNRTINAYSRGEGTATRESFQAVAMKNGEFRPGIIFKEDSSSLTEAVAMDPCGIAYGPMASGSTAVKILPVVPYNGIDAEFPTQQKVTSNKYPMPRPCFAYVNRTPGLPLDPAISEFLHFVLSREGQSTVAEVGLLPAPPEFLDIARVRLDR